MMSTCCSKHVEARNKYIEKECVKLVIKLKNYEESKFILLKKETPCNILYIQIKIYLLSILNISLQIQYNLNLKIREDRNHYRYINSVHKTYLQMCYSHVQPLQLLTTLNCGRSDVCNFLVETCLQTKGRIRRNA